MWDCKRGQPRPTQPWAWRYTFTGWHGTHDSFFAVGWEHKKAEGRGSGGVCEEGRQLTLNGGKRERLATKSPVEPSSPQGRIPMWLDALWLFPRTWVRCCPRAMMKEVFKAALPTLQLCILTSSVLIHYLLGYRTPYTTSNTFRKVQLTSVPL